MIKSVLRLICIFCLVLSLSLYFEPDEMFVTDEAGSKNVLCMRGGWTSNRDNDKCPKVLSYKKSTVPYAARKLPDLPPPPDDFSDDSDSQNEFSWERKKYDAGAWSQYQKDCQDQSTKGQTCDLVEIVSKIKEDTRLVKFAESAGSNQKIQKEINEMVEKLRLGNEQCGKGSKTLFRNVKELRGDKGGRVYYRKVNGKIEILAKSNKVKREQDAVIKILKSTY